MTRLRLCLLLLPLLLAAGRPALAQQEPPCMKDFMAVREEAEKRGLAVKTASDHHATAQEACPLFTALVAAQAKMVKFVQENSSWCGIPPKVLDDIKAGHKRTAEMRGRICKLAANPPRPAGPSLSESLGTSRVPDSSNVKSGRGTYDTLTGTPLGNAQK